MSAANKVCEEDRGSEEESQVPDECSMCGCESIVGDDEWKWLGCEECEVWVHSHCVGVHLKGKWQRCVDFYCVDHINNFIK